MRRHLLLSIILMVMTLAACASPTPQPTPTLLPPTTAPPTTVPTATPRRPPTAAPTPTAEPTPAPPSAALPLSLPGPYAVGWRNFFFKDAARNNKVVAIALYYPVPATEGAADGKAIQNAAPDVTGAPYPVVLGAGKESTYFGIHLASYGIVFAGLEPQDNTPEFGPWLLDYPRDVIFALNQMAAGKLDGFAGILDPEHAGVLGYSFDSYATLQMSGARMDPAYCQAQCAAAAMDQAALPKGWIEAWGMCALLDQWDEFAALAGESVTRSDDGLWQPLADPRVRAVMPMGNDALILFGERGLAAIDRPTLVLESSEDEGYPYASEMFRYMPKEHAALITNVGKDHMILLDPGGLGRMRHFIVSFFGYHLLGRKEYAPYFSREFVEQQEGLAWGVVE